MNYIEGGEFLLVNILTLKPTPPYSVQHALKGANIGTPGYRLFQYTALLQGYNAAANDSPQILYQEVRKMSRENR